MKIAIEWGTIILIGWGLGKLSPDLAALYIIGLIVILFCTNN